jgi:hypothetical protein
MVDLNNVSCMLPNYECKNNGDAIILFNKIYEDEKWNTMSIACLSVPISISLLIDDKSKVYIDKDYNIFGTADYSCFINERHAKRWRSAYYTYLTIVSIAVFIAILIVTSQGYKLLIETGFNVASVLLFIFAAIIVCKYFSIINVYKKRLAIMDKYKRKDG